jgi:hypothetical protein
MAGDPGVGIPGGAIGPDDTDVAEPLQTLLTDLNVLGGSDTTQGGTITSLPSQSTAIIEAGATTLAKWWSVVVGIFGGTAAVTAAATRFWSAQPGATRVALVAATGAIIVATLIGLALIVSADIRSRAVGATGVYAARAQIATEFVRDSYNASVPHAAASPILQAALKASTDDVRDALSTQIDTLQTTVQKVVDDQAAISADVVAVRMEVAKQPVPVVVTVAAPANGDAPAVTT